MKRKIIFETQRLIVREWQSEDEMELKKFLQ
ncbi:MAG: GNAT family N-acetyltransferase, partial [Enterococcus faecalis]